MSASPTASADDPQFPATMDVTPIWMKFSASGLVIATSSACACARR